MRETRAATCPPSSARAGDSLVFGHYLVSLPFVNYGGPLGEPDAVGILTREAVRISDASRVKLLELRSRVPLALSLPVSRRKITVVLDLPASGEALMKAIPAKVRSQVRRPQKEGVTVRFGLDQVASFFAVFSRHMREPGHPNAAAFILPGHRRDISGERLVWLCLPGGSTDCVWGRIRLGQ